MPGSQLDSHKFLEKYPYIRYGVPASLLFCLFGFILFATTAELVVYGNYNNALGGFVPVYLYFMSITASLLAAYRASRGVGSEGENGGSGRQKALSGILAALVVSLLPVLVFTCLALTIIDNMIFEFMIALLLIFTPLPAAILGGLTGYFITGNSFPGGKGSFKGFIMVVSAVLLLELAVFLILVYGAVGMGFVPYDPGRVIPP